MTFCEKSAKKEAEASKNKKYPLTNRQRMCYDVSPYCDSMPFQGHSSQHGHITTDGSGCQAES